MNAEVNDELIKLKCRANVWCEATVHVHVHVHALPVDTSVSIYRSAALFRRSRERITQQHGPCHLRSRAVWLFAGITLFCGRNADKHLNETHMLAERGSELPRAYYVQSHMCVARTCV